MIECEFAPVKVIEETEQRLLNEHFRQLREIKTSSLVIQLKHKSEQKGQALARHWRGNLQHRRASKLSESNFKKQWWTGKILAVAAVRKSFIGGGSNGMELNRNECN